MQRSPAANAGAPAIPEPEDNADLEPPPHATPPDEAAESPTQQSPEQIRAPHRSWRVVGAAPGQGIAVRDGPNVIDIGTCSRG